MCKRLFLFLLIMMCIAVSADAANKTFTLVIDAGHGGHDAGALGSFSKEKNVALNVALAFGRYVENNCPDVKVVYTRKTDVFIPLQERANIANRNKADLFVSIHANALPKGKISRGMETYTLGMHRANDNFEVAKRENSVILVEKDYKQRYAGFDPRSSESYIMFELIQDKNMAQSVEMAKLVQQKTCAEAGRTNKGVKQAGFLVLRETSMPSCLIELGFITTPDEERSLNDKNTIDAYGRGIYKAFVAYRKKRGGMAGVPYKAEPAEKVSVPQIVPEQPKPSQELAAQRQEPVKAATALAQAETAKEPQQAEQPEETKAEQPVKVQAEQNPDVKDADGSAETLVFKVQVAASQKPISLKAPCFKKRTDVESYQEGGMYKYTVGASDDYFEVYRLFKNLQTDFPGSFIVAFKNGEKMQVNAAIKEFKDKKGKK